MGMCIYQQGGPFNGRQLTTIICVVAAAVLFPFGAWAAVSFTNVAITDPGGVNQAKVDAKGKLAVGDGAGALTVDGSVGASLPSKPITIARTTVASTRQLIYGPQSKPFGITSITVSSSCDVSVEFDVYSHQSAGGLYPIEVLNVAAGGTNHVTYPSPLVLTPSPGGTVTLEGNTNSVIGCIDVTAVGIQS